MRKLVISLFFIGLTFEIFAFLIDNAAQISWITQITARKYFLAKRGLDQLKEKKILNSNDQGFIVLEEMVIIELHKSNPANLLINIHVKNFKRGTPFLGFDSDYVGTRTPVDIFLSNGQTIKWSLEQLSEKVEVLRESLFLKSAILIFCAGVVIQIISFIIDSFEKKRKSRGL
ncbi:MAG: hypothetical protein KAW56_14270 [Candidatus Marinimicrobia bacterium]|nr:hypothetical protein [candidate division WOR-3 bacterium]MCK4448233.1 hypothetical protein [Candidatus Neomarinimicrobiota bacterium]